MSAHTPGPWLVILTSTGEWQVFADKYNVIICDNVWDHTANKTGNSIEANAHIIAAAPELLEALIDMVAIAQLDKWDQAVSGRQSFLWNAKVAIAKARGEL